MSSGVYSIRNKKNGKRYIGSSSNIDMRWDEHRRRLNQNKHGNQRLQNAWNKYGAERFVFEVIAYCDPIELIELEQFYIDSYLSAEKRHGYNVLPTAGNRLGAKHTDESISKMSAAQKEVWNRPDARTRKLAAKNAWENQPERVERRSAIAKESMNRPDVKARLSALQKKLCNTSERLAKSAAISKDVQNRPEVRARKSESQKKVWSRPGFREKMSKNASGENGSQTKLTEDIVRDIRRRVANGERQPEIAKRYSITQQTVSDISCRRTWKHLE